MLYNYANNDNRFIRGKTFPDPFVTYATMNMPRTVEEMLRWCEQIWLRNSTYSAAGRRVVSYFLTKVEIQEAGDIEKKKYDDFLNNKLDVMTHLNVVGIDFLCYGNSFTSIYLPFRRMLKCTNAECRRETPIERVDYSFRGFKFQFKCNSCECDCEVDKPIDRRTLEEDKVSIIRWSPHFIRTRHNPVSNKTVYLLDPDPNLKKAIRNGDTVLLRDTPWELIEAIRDNKLFRFADDAIFHLKEPGLAGIFTNGWGVSRTLSNFSQAFHVQMLKLYNEIMCHEYIVPFRVVTPDGVQTNNPNGDPMLTTSLGNSQHRILSMLREFRRNPGGWHALPFNIKYQALGGEGMTTVPFELINAATDEMLNAAGVPAELYKGSLSIQAMPIALRLFQQQWPHFVAGCNAWLNWLMRRLSQAFHWQPARARLQPPTLADDLENKQILLQLSAAQQVSRAVAFAPLGVDPKENMQQILDEQAEFEELQRKFKAKQDQKLMLEQQMQSPTMQQAGVAGGGEGPAAAGPGVTPGDLVSKAEQIAAQLVKMPYEQRRAEMLKIKKSDETLHSLVKAKMESHRNDAEAQGRQSLQEQGP